ncbi:hypothetical protein GCM10027521_25520 [Amycolatopsis cihanbeyliensis]
MLRVHSGAQADRPEYKPRTNRHWPTPGGKFPAQVNATDQRKDGTETQNPRCPGSPLRDDDWQRDDVNRRELLRLMTLTGSLLAIPASAVDVDRIAYSATNPRRLDPVTLDNYKRLNANLWPETTPHGR